MTHPVTVQLGGSDVLNVTGGSTSFQLTTLRQSVLLQYQAAGAIWHVMTGDLALAQLDARYLGTSTINDTTPSTSTVYSSTKTNAAITAATTALVNGAPGALDTLKELADALGDDANYATTITNVLALKAPLASPALTGTPTVNGVPLSTGGTVTAASVTYDPTSSGVVGDTHTPPIPEYDLQGALDWLNRDVTDRDQATYLDAVADTLRLVQGLIGAAPAVTPDGTYYGMAPLDSNRRVPVANLGSGTPDGTKFLRDDGAFAAPTAVASRTAPFLPADNGLKTCVSDPAAFSSAIAVVASRAYAARLFVPSGKTLTSYEAFLTAGTGTAGAGYYFALYDGTGALISGSATADSVAAFTTGGDQTANLGTPYTMPADGYVYVLMQIGTAYATTMPKINCSADSIGMANVGCTTGLNASQSPGVGSSTALRWGIPSNSFTGSTPPSTLGTLAVNNGLPFWIGLR